MACFRRSVITFQYASDGSSRKREADVVRTHLLTLHQHLHEFFGIGAAFQRFGHLRCIVRRVGADFTLELTLIRAHCDALRRTHRRCFRFRTARSIVLDRMKERRFRRQVLRHVEMNFR